MRYVNVDSCRSVGIGLRGTRRIRHLGIRHLDWSRKIMDQRAMEEVDWGRRQERLRTNSISCLRNRFSEMMKK